MDGDLAHYLATDSSSLFKGTGCCNLRIWAMAVYSCSLLLYSAAFSSCCLPPCLQFECLLIQVHQKVLRYDLGHMEGYLKVRISSCCSTSWGGKGVAAQKEICAQKYLCEIQGCGQSNDRRITEEQRVLGKSEA